MIMMVSNGISSNRGSGSADLKVAPSCAGKKRKRGNNKRRDYPKKALSAYNIFFKETREKILTEHGKTNFQEMVRKIAALWKEITPEDKLRFDAIASRDLVRYKREVSEYEQYIVEKCRKQSVAEKEKNIEKGNGNSIFNSNSVGVASKPNHENEDDRSRIVFSIRSSDSAAARTEKGHHENSGSTHTLTSNELQLAHHHLNEERQSTESFQKTRKHQTLPRPNTKHGISSNGTLHSNCRSLTDHHRENKLTATELELYRQNILGMRTMRRDIMAATGETLIGNRIPLDLHNGRTVATIAQELDIKRRIAQRKLKDHLSIASTRDALKKQLGFDGSIDRTLDEIGRRVDLGGNNATVSYELKSREILGPSEDEMRFRKNLEITGVDPMVAKVKNLVSEALKMSHFGGSDLVRNFTPTPLEDIDICSQLKRGNQISIPNEICNSLPREGGLSSKGFNTGSETVSASREAEVQKLRQINGLRNHIAVPDVALQKHLALMRTQALVAEQLVRSSSQTIGINRHYNDIQIQGERILQQERLQNGLNSGASSFTRGELSSGKALKTEYLQGKYSLPDGRIISDSVSSQSRGVDFQPVLTQSQLSLFGMDRLNNMPQRYLFN